MSTIGSDRRLVVHSLLYTAGTALQGFALLAVVPIATRIIGPVEYGRLGVALTVVQLGAVVVAAGLPLAITRAFFDRDDGPRRARALTGLLALTAVGLSLLGALAVGLLMPWSPPAGSTGADSLVPALLGVAGVSVVAAVQAVLRAQGRPVLFVLLGLGVSIGAHAVAVAVALARPTAAAYLLGYLLGVVAAALAAVTVVRPTWPWSVPGAVAEGTRIGLPVLPHSIALLALTMGDPLLLERTGGPLLAGHYHAALVYGVAPLTLLAAVNNAVVPAVLALHGPAQWAEMRRLAGAVIAIAGVLAAGTMLAAGAVSLLIDPGFPRGQLVRVIQVMALASLGQAGYLLTSTVLFAQKHTRPLAVITPTVVVVTVALAWTPAAHGRLVPVAAAKAAGFVLLAIGCWWAAGRVAPVRWPWRIAGGTGVLLLVVFGVVSLLPATGPASMAEFGVAALLGLGLVAAVLIVLRRGRSAPAAPPVSPSTRSDLLR